MRVLQAGRGVVCAVLLAAVAASAQETVRLPAVAGEYYPADPYTLQQAMLKYLGDSPAPVPEGRIIACVVPYAPYGLSAGVMASPFKHLQPGQYDRVVVLAPPTSQELRGCSIAEVDAYATPMGWVPVDTTATKKLSYSPLVQTKTVNYRGAPRGVHEKNASIEVVLPFLQQQLGLFRLVPIVVGDLFEGDPRLSNQRFEVIADAVREVVDDRTLIVVCAHFSHYGEAFGYAPFDGGAEEGVRKLDMDLVDFVLKQDGVALEAELARTRNIMHGRSALHVLMALLPDDLRGTMVAYDTTGRATGRWENSISFAGIVFSNPALPPNQAYPERAMDPKSPSDPAPVTPAPEVPEVVEAAPVEAPAP
jgi:AmmeMemoRadiSam system protein B